MAAWRCPRCNVNYPTSTLLNRKCPRCQQILVYYTGLGPDAGWDEGLDIKSSDEPKTAHPDGADGVLLIYRDETDTIHLNRQQLAQHYKHLEAGDIVRVAGKHYEILGYDNTKNEWWVQRMEFYDEWNDIHELPETWERHEVFEDEDVEGWALFEYPPPENDGQAD